jgi:hypothetical protein
MKTSLSISVKQGDLLAGWPYAMTAAVVSLEFSFLFASLFRLCFAKFCLKKNILSLATLNVGVFEP